MSYRDRNKEEPLLSEIRKRAINIENKVNSVIQSMSAITQYGGSSDQQFGHISYSQHGEDLIILNTFALLGVGRPSYLDVGAHSPTHISNTALLSMRGSTGINIEANPDLIEDFHRHRPRDVNLNIGVAPQKGVLKFYRIDERSGVNTFSKDAAEAFVRNNSNFRIQDILDIEVVTLNEVIDQHASGVFPDFMTIDIEGLDFDVLRTTDFSKSRPTLVCVEAVSAAGSVAGAMGQMMREKGFKPYIRTTGNLFFTSPDAHEKIMNW
ncbi:FkbM family methyltransferase [Inquilinus sp. CA228]|uniref:FkbM family methyltransferase n=1 Tax=Inquilinus sp. CA228 TaxID=3455609 RepID=UPI003F8D642C